MEKRASVRVVDDENGIRQSFNMVLKDEFTVLLAGSDKEALKQYTRFKIDLIILDVGMPGMGGIKCLQQILP